MAEDEKFENIEGEKKEFEVDELNEGNLEGVAGGVEADEGISAEAPGNNCTNSASNC
jgi:hypothetical protein